MTDLVEKELKRLEEFEVDILMIGEKMRLNCIYDLDFIANAVMNRSLSLISGFISLIKDENYLAACHLVRCHLDSLLRFSAVWLVKEPHIFAEEIRNGKRVDLMKDRDGMYMRDSYLKDKLSKEFPWIKKVYEETSGFIHLSKKHISASSRIKDVEDKTLEFRISKKDNYVNDALRVNATLGMIEITKVLCEYLEGWNYTKDNPPNT